MSEEYNADFIAGYGDGVLRLSKEKETPDYIAGYEMGRRLRERKQQALPQQSKQAPFEIPEHTQYDSGYKMGFVSVPQTSLDEHMAHASNDFARDAYYSLKNDELLLTPPSSQGNSKRPKRGGGKSKRRGGKSKRRGGKTKKRNQKK